MGIRNVIFDLGGVLLEWNPMAVLAQFEPDLEARRRLRAGLFGHPDWQAFDRGSLSEAEIVQRLQIRLGLPVARVLEIVDAVRASLVEKPDSVRLLRALHRQGVALYCLSNMPASIYLDVQRRHGFWDVFRGIVISGEVRMIKPEPQLFAHLIERFGLKPAETLFIDDLAVNVEAARNAGMSVILFRDARQCEQQLGALIPPAA